jgi:SapC
MAPNGRNQAKAGTMKQAGKKPPAAGMPLFFSNPVPVSAERHARSGVRANLATSFARATNSIPVSVAEFVEAAKHYPIAFSSETPAVPLVVVGLENGNYFVDETGAWKDKAYVPAYVRKYPFLFAETPGSDQWTLCIDENAPQFVARGEGDEVTRLYKNGEPSDFTRSALAFCAAIQEQYVISRRFCETLHSLDLLAPQRSDARLASGREVSLGGFQLIDQDRFQKLPDDKIVELHKQGLTALIHACLFSLTNWQKLVDMASMREPKTGR